MNIWNNRVQVMRARYGWRPSRAPACPRVVVGKRCQIGYPSLRMGGRCVCQRYQPLFDHGAMWLDSDGAHVLTGEPYHIDQALLAALIQETTGLGVEITVSGDESPWCPGGTTLLVVRARAASGAGP